jgi:hypothetical protein
MSIRNIDVDADRQRRAARAAGAADGARNSPPASPEPDVACDHFATGNRWVSRTTNLVRTADHLGGARANDDAAIATASAETAEATARTAHHRQRATDAESESAAARRSLPINALVRVFPHWMVYPVHGLLGLSSGAATVASLLSATEDTKELSYAIGIGVAVATIVGALVPARLLRERELNDIDGAHYTSEHRRTLIVYAVGALGVVCLGLGVAQMRSYASAADAKRRVESTTIEATGVLAGQDAVADPAVESEPSSIPMSVWLLLETGLICSAFTVEYLLSNPRREHIEERERVARDERDSYDECRAGLMGKAGMLAERLVRRDDHDAAIAVLTDAHDANAHAVIETYRDGNEKARSVVGPVFPGDESTKVPEAIRQGAKAAGSFVCSDLDAVVNGSTPTRLVEEPSAIDPSDPRYVLREAFRELARTPDPAELAAIREPHVPGDETILDRAAIAKAAAIEARSARHTAVAQARQSTPDRLSEVEVSMAEPMFAVAEQHSANGQEN